MGFLRNDDNPAILRDPMVSKYLQMLVAQDDHQNPSSQQPQTLRV